MRPLLAHHPIAEERSAVGKIHQCFGAVHIAIGTIDEFKPETAEAVGIPHAARKTVMPRLQSAEVEGVLAWQFGVATEVEGLRWLQLQALKLGLYLGSVAIDALVFRPTELLHLDHGELLISVVVLPLPHGVGRLK